MLPFTVPDPVRAFLRDATGRTIVRDPDGNVIGFFAPVKPEEPLPNGQAPRLIDKRLNGEPGDDCVQRVLRGAAEPVQLCDEAGNVIGYFAPVPPDQAESIARTFPQPDPSKADEDPLADLRADFDVAAIEREMATNDKWYTLAEVYEHILSITPEPYWRGYLQAQIDRLKERDRCATP
jgi:hypothetical protein